MSNRLDAMLGRLRRRVADYDAARYWEGRAEDIIDTYDHPETWEERQWLRGGVEETAVPAVLAEHGCRSVLIIGAGSGRQYEFLAGGFEVRGFDISPALVAEARARHPTVPTEVADVTDCARFGPVDAVVSSAVLAHVPPRRIRTAVEAVQGAAEKLIVLREYVWLKREASYMWAHDYENLLAPWQVRDRLVTDERPDARAELLVFAPPEQP